MPAWPMTLPSSMAVVVGCAVAELEAEDDGVVVEAEWGRMIMKARVPLFGDLTMASR